MSDSYAYGGQPRSVPDPDKDAYDEMIRPNKMLGDREFTLVDSDPSFPDVGHPGALESVIPLWGSGREALADLHDGNYGGAAMNGALGVSDAFLAKAVVGGLLKGGLRRAGNFAWRSAPWEEQGMRKWLGDQGFLKPGQPGHHWWLEQKSSAPDWLKNQPPFVKGTADAVEHGRIPRPLHCERNEATPIQCGPTGLVRNSRLVQGVEFLHSRARRRRGRGRAERSGLKASCRRVLKRNRP